MPKDIPPIPLSELKNITNLLAFFKQTGFFWCFYIEELFEKKKC